MIVYGSAANNYVLNRACNVADGTPSFEIVLGGTRRIEIEADGDIYNVNGTYGTISDARLKETSLMRLRSGTHQGSASQKL